MIEDSPLKATSHKIEPSNSNQVCTSKKNEAWKE